MPIVIPMDYVLTVATNAKHLEIITKKRQHFTTVLMVVTRTANLQRKSPNDGVGQWNLYLMMLN